MAQNLNDVLEQLDAEQIHLIYKAVFEESDNGRLVLQDLKNRGYCYSTTQVGDNPYETACNEGSRRILLHIQTMLTKPEQTLQEEDDL